MNRVTFFYLLILLIASNSNNLCTNVVTADQPDDGVVRPALANSKFKYYRGFDGEKPKKTSGQDKVQASNEDKLVESNQDRSSSNRTSPTEIWSRKSIQEISIDIRETHKAAPTDRSSELNYGSGDWTQFSASPKVFAWAAPDIRYQPLYFEDVALERYGQTASINVQPIRSAAHFFKSVVLLPNHVLHDHPDSCDYPLGFCRPGSNVPCIQQIHYYGRPNR